MQQDSQIQTITKQFDGKSITTFEYDGKLCWIGREVGAVLGYAGEGAGLITAIGRDWSEEMEEGRDYLVFRGKELKQFKEFAQLNENSSFSPRTPNLMLLLEPGFHFVCIKTDKPVGKKLRRLIVDEVLPQLVRDGQYLHGRTVDDRGELTWRDGVDRNFEIRERDLALREREFKMNVADRTLRLREEKERRLQDSKKGKALRLGAKYRLKLGRITEGQYHAICLKACEIEVGGRIGTDDSDLKQIDGKLYSPTRAADGKLYSPTRAAAMLGVSVHAVGLAVSRIEKRLGISDIRKDERYVSPQAHMVQFTDGSTIHPDGYLMRENLFQMVKEELKGRGPTSEQMKLSFN